MGDTYLGGTGFPHDTFRSLFAWFDSITFGLLNYMYQIFFNVSSVEIFSSETVTAFYSRVQLIIGVYMMFQLALIIIKGIVNPDDFFGNSKNAGASGLIMRVCTALFLLVSLIPINSISNPNSYEKKIKNNGLLFGTLYSLQERIMYNNTLGKLILGGGYDFYSGDSDDSSKVIEKASNSFTSAILKSFYRINLVDESNRTSVSTGAEEYTVQDNILCDPNYEVDTEDGDDIPVKDLVKLYARDDVNPQDIISMVNYTCRLRANGGWESVVSALRQKTYLIVYNGVISTIVAVVFSIILLSFSVDVAVRAIKLGILRLIAPIPIISYMDPKGSKDGAFNSWIKTLTSTYIDLFLRIAIVYFILFLINTIIHGGLDFQFYKGGFIGVLSKILVFIALFIFAKQAPKFIKQVLGIKDDGFKIFGGIGAAMGVTSAAMGVGASIGGIIGSGIASAKASRMADETRESFGEVPPGTADRFRNKAKHLVAGITGGIAGGYAGTKAAVTAKDHGFNSSLEAMRKRNQDILTRGNDGSTILGRWGSMASNVFKGEGSADSLAREIESNKARIDALKAIKNRVSGEMVKKDWTKSVIGKYDESKNKWSYFMNDIYGNEVKGEINYKDFMARKNAASSAGLNEFEISTFEFDSATNKTKKVNKTISMTDAERYQGLLLKGNEDDYIKQHVSGNVTEDSRLITLIHDATVLGGSSEFLRNSDGTIEKGSNKPIVDRASITDAIDGFEDYNTSLNRKNAISKANDRFSGNKKQ